MTIRSVAILGAGGFIGRHVVRELAGRGYFVNAVTLEPSLDSDTELVRWHQVDLDDHDVNELQGDAAVHLAEPSILTDSDQARRNTIRMRRVLDARFARIIYASSALVYGDRADTPRAEDALPDPVSLYARTKLEVEAIAHLDYRCAIARLANVYGTGMSATNVLTDILGQLHTPGPLRVRDLSPVRDYVHVVDVARALADLVESPVRGTINIATGEGTSVETLVRIACRAAGTPDRELTETAARSTRSVLILDTARARRELHWNPTISVEAGVTRMVQEQMS